ncbi:hypothetical protein I317_00007 [Kwoniella heveanensis CBS 569]|uniref:Uncharacterized protein n=1 Tax=Kwoniella heveanensis BCC8398 TaxID=1296120 RepID=A0A1B9H1W6_9TREE|nr:hypothetical protein I316_01175 [Kwoniella heveanensis BCC8398]OCF45921.1 hypothetical protein I317_00007 [Kwoniella heveanensis CBS 569]
MLATLTDLPAELTQRIHLLAHNPFFPLSTRSVYHSLHNPSAYYAATYLLSLYEEYGPNEIVLRSVRHPVCDVRTAKEIKRIWDKRRGHVDPVSVAASNGSDSGSGSGRREGIASAESTSSAEEKSFRRRSRSSSQSVSTSRSRSPSPAFPPPPSAPPLTCSELPRRLFRDPPPLTTLATSTTIPRTSDNTVSIHPLIRYLFTTYHPSANSHKGYPLFRAILTSNYELVSFLLKHGADPGTRDCFALEIAISMKDLKMVKLLVERDSTIFGVDSTPSPHTNSKAGKGKKAKLNDRVEIGTRMVQKAIEKGSKDIINYFVLEKKVMPPLQSIMSLGKPQRISPSSKKRKRLSSSSHTNRA